MLKSAMLLPHDVTSCSAFPLSLPMAPHLVTSCGHGNRTSPHLVTSCHMLCLCNVHHSTSCDKLSHVVSVQCSPKHIL
eukprot:gene19520-biopygen8474